MKHLEFWLGDILGNFVPGIGQGVRSVDTPDYFGCIGGLLADMLATDILTADTLKTLTNKAVYAEMTSSLPPPKVARESNREYGNVWTRLHNPVVEVRARDVLYLLVHNKLPVPERLFRIRLKPDPYCQFCESAEIADVEHLCCLCEKTSMAWAWVRGKLVGIGGQQQQNLDDWDLLNLFFISCDYDKEIVWLISSYVLYVWENVFVRGAEVKLEKFFGFLTYKYREHQSSSKPKLKDMHGFS